MPIRLELLAADEACRVPAMSGVVTGYGLLPGRAALPAAPGEGVPAASGLLVLRCVPCPCCACPVLALIGRGFCVIAAWFPLPFGVSAKGLLAGGVAGAVVRRVSLLAVPLDGAGVCRGSIVAASAGGVKADCMGAVPAAPLGVSGNTEVLRVPAAPWACAGPWRDPAPAALWVGGCARPRLAGCASWFGCATASRLIALWDSCRELLWSIFAFVWLCALTFAPPCCMLELPDIPAAPDVPLLSEAAVLWGTDVYRVWRVAPEVPCGADWATLGIWFASALPERGMGGCVGSAPWFFCAAIPAAPGFAPEAPGWPAMPRFFPAAPVPKTGVLALLVWLAELRRLLLRRPDAVD